MHYMVTLKPGSSPEELEKAKESAKSAGGKITHESTLIKSFNVEVPNDKINTLETNEHVTVEADSEVTTQTSPRKYASSSLPSPATQRWSHPPTSANITDDEVARLAAKPLHALTLADLVRHGRPPLSASALFSSANFTLSLLPIRLAHRLQSLRNLPYIVVSNPHISKIYNNYLHSLSTLLPYTERQINNLEDEIKFTEVMADLVQTHSNTIPVLARGFLECRKYISPVEVTRFLDEHLRARIGTRLIAEQHIALHFSSQPHNDGGSSHITEDHSNYIGVIYTALRPASIIRNCESFVSEICELKYGVRPTVVINGQPDTTFAHIPVHLEYIITELLKNAFRATVESGKEKEAIEVTIAATPDELTNDNEDSHLNQGENPHIPGSEAENMISSLTQSISSSNRSPNQQPNATASIPGCTIRFRDKGGGISPTTLPNIWSYSFTTFNDEDLPNSPNSNPNPNNNTTTTNNSNGNIDALNMISGAGGQGSSLAGLGYGLPLGRAYAEYFGGGIQVQSLWGWGTDVYLRLRGVGEIA
ncbi:MAG: hypothetical protein M1812_007785 [Candelaria pacifica]|nr:MAG: hypothetical protein M1812_007785 [Candelaria pacifica]